MYYWPLSTKTISVLITCAADCEVCSVIRFPCMKGEFPPLIHHKLIRIHGPNVMTVEIV